MQRNWIGGMAFLGQEKVDGSLIKVFYYDGEWRVATNGTIDARDVITFKELPKVYK